MSFIFGIPIVVIYRQAVGLSEELPKKRGRTEVFASSPMAAKVPIGWHDFKYRSRFVPAGAVGTRIVPIRAPLAPGPLAIGPITCSIEEERRVQVLVRDNNVDQALKVLKKKMQREGVFAR